VTSHTRRVARLVLVAPLALGVGSHAFGQVPGGQATPAPRSPAVFGGVDSPRTDGDVLSVSASAVGGYDTNVLAAVGGTGGGGGGGGAIGSTEQSDSTFAGGSTSLQWSQQRARVLHYGAVSADYRRAFDIDNFDIQAYTAAGGLDLKTSARSRVQLNGLVGLQPFYQNGVLGAFGGQPSAIDGTANPSSIFTPDFQTAREKIMRYAAFAAYSHQLSPRTTFSANAGSDGFLPVNSEADDAGLLRLTRNYAAARLTRALTTSLSARVGYGYSQYDRDRRLPTAPEAADDQPTAIGVHNIDVGLNYNRALSIAHRTSFSFGTGSNVTQSSGTTVGQSTRTRVFVTGFAALRRDFLRTWTASLSYQRGTSYWEGYSTFGVFDGVSLSAGGLFTDRLDASVGVTYTNGSLGSTLSNRVSTISAGSQLRFALSRNVAMFAGYTFARFDTPPYGLPDDVFQTYRPERQGVRFGLTFWTDLLH
jgi:hypothetical protein